MRLTEVMLESRQLNAELGSNVTRLRSQQRITKKALALMVGISRPHLDKIESGACNARLSDVQRLADALNVDPAVLLGISRGGL